MTGQPNQAIALMNKFIDNDIDAQKANLGKESTLYSMALKKYGNVQAADAYAKLYATNTLQTQLQMSAARSGSDQAKAQAQMLSGQLEAQKAPLMNQIALLNTQARGTGMTGSGQGGLAPQEAASLFLQKPEMQAKHVNVNGRIYFAGDAGEAKELRKSEGEYKGVVDNLKQLEDMAKTGTNLSPEQRAIAKSLMARVSTGLVSINGFNRFTDMDDKTMREMFSDPNEFKTIFSGNSATHSLLQGLAKKMEDQREAALGATGYKRQAQRFSSFQPSAGQ
jgi:hypothetical protein